FPDLTAPSVTVITEAHGMAPQEVETLVTFPIETAINGASGVRRVRSSSATGLSVVWVEFSWGTDIYQARQVVNEKLQLASATLPPDVERPILAPISSIMGEIMFISLMSDVHSPMELRSTADWVIRPRLLSVPGVSQVIPIGGDEKQYQVLISPEKLAAYGVSLTEVTAAVKETNQNTSAGFYVEGGQEYLIHGVGRVRQPEEIANTVVALHDGQPVLVRHLADVRIGPAIKRGEGSAQGKPAVILGIQKQPGANTLTLTKQLDHTLDEIQQTLPAGMTINRHIFRQADFIQVSIDNVIDALRDGTLVVVVILLLFLMNVRATLITLTAVPLSLLVAVLALWLFGATINTMTLGGMAIAIGALVDDAIIDMENVFRRLRENALRPPPERQHPLTVTFRASLEIRPSITFATFVILLVFVPLFFLSGVEGRLLAPLGLAYIVSLFASLIVAVSVTPVLCSLLLPQAKGVTGGKESPMVHFLKRMYQKPLAVVVRYPGMVIVASAVLFVGTAVLIPFLGRAFLPEFNEGTLTINTVTLPGTSLAESNRLGQMVEEILLSFPEVRSTARRTGRAELDEHAQGVEAAEIDVGLTMQERSKEEFLQALRRALSAVPGVNITIGQPISHRIDHMLSGTRANIAVKIFGNNLQQLRILAQDVRRVMAHIPGVVDLNVEQQTDIPILQIRFDRERIARVGLRVENVAGAVETAFWGKTVSQVLEGQRSFALVVRYEDASRQDLDAIRSTLIDTPLGGKVPLSLLAEVTRDLGPNTINRENVQRRIVVSSNVAGRDLQRVVQDIQREVAAQVQLPQGYYVVYGGQFESAEEASRTIGFLSVLVLAGIVLLLMAALRSLRDALIILVNLPLALIGGVFGVFVSGGVLSVASLIGFITLFGIATRNGIMMVAHIRYLMAEEGESFRRAVERGALERLSPILMTALSAGLALVPLALRGGEPGSEILTPMAIVILFGLLSSTALNMLVVPALYLKFGRPLTEQEAAV
ncbi:MAG: efflux RND transporter permease subunit, partial [Deltaproteobacteria bacterium]|nr:efflux RND transporter permease subunit [Deltaproteobacteria bacterium]